MGHFAILGSKALSLFYLFGQDQTQIILYVHACCGWMVGGGGLDQSTSSRIETQFQTKPSIPVNIISITSAFHVNVARRQQRQWTGSVDPKYSRPPPPPPSCVFLVQLTWTHTAIIICKVSDLWALRRKYGFGQVHRWITTSNDERRRDRGIISKY